MLHPAILSIGTVILVSLVSFVGILIFSASEQLIRRSLQYFVSLSAGVLFGDVFLHILPELSEGGGMTIAASLMLLTGILTSFVIEKIIHWHHCHILPSKDHYHPVGALTLFGDGIHNFVDGALIAGSFLVSPTLGYAAAVAIALHEIPQEISDFALLIYSGYSRKAALLWNFLSALASLGGAGLVLLAHDTIPDLSMYLLAFAGGNFLYIAGADLIPELHKETRLRCALLQLLCICTGIGIMQVIAILE